MFHFGDQRSESKCSFCAKKQSDVRKLIAGPGVYICDECVELCGQIIAEELRGQPSWPVPDIPPDAVTTALMSRLHGESIQGPARQLARILFRHLVRATPSGDLTPPPGHVLLMGPTGSGKSALVAAMRATIPLPIAVVDVSQVTETGYFGVNPPECLSALIHAADFDVKRAARGILVLDHFDLVDNKGDPRLSVQREFLSQLEGTTVAVPPQGELRSRDRIEMDTRDVLYVACGTFESRSGKEALPGSVEHLRLWGMVAPLLARLPHRIVLTPPDAADLEAILVAEGGPWQALLSQRRPALVVADDAPQAVAALAASLGMGAWGLTQVLSSIEDMLAVEEQVEILDRAFVERVGSTI